MTWSAQNRQKATMEAQVEMQLKQFKAELEARTEAIFEQIKQRFEAWKVDREHEHNVELEHINGGYADRMSSERTAASERILKRGQQHPEQKPERKCGGEHLAKIADAISRPKKINRDESGNITGIGHHHLLRAVRR